jgi:hypothetical protein
MMIEAMPIILPRDSAVIAGIRRQCSNEKVFRQTTFGNCRRTYGSSIRRGSNAKCANCWRGTHRSSL